MHTNIYIYWFIQYIHTHVYLCQQFQGSLFWCAVPYSCIYVYTYINTEIYNIHIHTCKILFTIPGQRRFRCILLYLCMYAYMHIHNIHIHTHVNLCSHNLKDKVSCNVYDFTCVYMHICTHIIYIYTHVNMAYMTLHRDTATRQNTATHCNTTSVCTTLHAAYKFAVIAKKNLFVEFAEASGILVQFYSCTHRWQGEECCQ